MSQRLLDHPLAVELAPGQEDLAATLSTGSGSVKVRWSCPKGHEWSAAPYNRIKLGFGCAVCSNRQLLAGVNDLASVRPELAAEWHPIKNDKLEPSHVFASAGKKVWWQCRQGHEWVSTVNNRARGKGCAICAGNAVGVGETDLATVAPELAAQWHPIKNGELTPRDVALRSARVVWWQCEQGHEWENSVSGRHGRAGCPYCSGQKVILGENDLATLHPAIAKEWHTGRNEGLSPSQVLPGTALKAWWQCEQGHEWEQSVLTRTKYQSRCPLCSGQRVDQGTTDLATTHPAVAAEWHPTKNGELTPVDLTHGSAIKIWWQCVKGHEWQAVAYSRTGTNAKGCPLCKNETFASKAELELRAFLAANGIKFKPNDRKLLKGTEIDLYLPEHNFGIEFNGLWYHSEYFKPDTKFHQKKWAAAKAVGVQLLQVWEDDWKRNPELVKEMILHKIGVATRNRVYARKTQIAEISYAAATAFLNRYHIQQSISGTHYLGLQLDGELVAVLVLRKSSGNRLEITRYATSAQVVGGFTKLLKAAVRFYAPSGFYTFSDNTVSDGGLYADTGFTADLELAPDYMYVHNGVRRHKFNYRISKFRTNPNLQFKEGLSERELAELNRLPRIWDAGKVRWVLPL